LKTCGVRAAGQIRASATFAAEIERLRYQLAQARAEVGLLREQRDELRQGVEKAMEQISRQ